MGIEHGSVFRGPDRALAFCVKVFLGADARKLPRLSVHLGSHSLGRSLVRPQAVLVASRLGAHLEMIHEASLGLVDVGVSAGAITVVMDVLNGGTPLFGVVEEEVTSCLCHWASSRLSSGLERKGISTVTHSDVRVSAASVYIINSSLASNLEDGTHLVLNHSANLV